MTRILIPKIEALKYVVNYLDFIILLGTLFIARNGLSTRMVRIAERLKFSDAIKYSTVLKTNNYENIIKIKNY
jgi:hypothetical protein